MLDLPCGIGLVPVSHKGGRFVCREGGHFRCRGGVSIRDGLQGEGTGQPQLFLAGFGPYEDKVMKFISDKGLSASVFIVGRTQTAFKLLIEKDLLAVPSLFDSYPNVILEALHTGTPVIASRVGGIPDILKYEDLLFQPGDPQDLYLKLVRIVEDEEYYKRIRVLCRERKQYFVFDWIGEFKKIMKERNFFTCSIVSVIFQCHF